jgi:hypothetical protein
VHRAPCDDLVDDNWTRWILRLGLEIGSRRADAKRGEPGEARSQSTVKRLGLSPLFQGFMLIMCPHWVFLDYLPWSVIGGCAWSMNSYHVMHDDADGYSIPTPVSHWYLRSPNSGN